MDNRLDLLTSVSGIKITNVSDWEKFRKPEITVLLENFVYGVRPYETPEKIEFVQKRCEDTYLGHDIRYKEIEIRVNDVPFDLQLFLPKSALPVPVFLFIENEYYIKQVDFSKKIDYDFLPICDILSRGYGVAVLPVTKVYPDWTHHAEFKKGVFAAMQPNVLQRTPASWAGISAWAFGASRVMDYLERDADVEHTKTAVIGHSRCGKAALWAGATDPRFALVVSNSSGCTGAAYTRGKKGEHTKDINISDWFCDNYRCYNDREEMLPLDQHWLLSLIAPRPLYIKSDGLDEWADPEAELFSAKLASAVYELYGKKGVITDEKIVPNKKYHAGTIAYHRTPHEHDLTAFDWQCYMDFADVYLK